MVPRVSYFPLVIDKVIKHFNRFVAESKHNSADMWLDFEGQPLKWYVKYVKYVKYACQITEHTRT